jgi:hypothetical protein
MAAKYLFQNKNEQEEKPMFAVRNMLPLLLVALLCSLSFGATFRTVKQGGGGNYTMIQDALDDSGPSDVNGIIEVQDNGVYTENLVFPPPSDVNFLTLRARDGNSPTITLSGTTPETNYIDIRAVGTTIQGFKINFSGNGCATDSNNFMIHAAGGASTVRDCNIVGPTSGYMRGIAGVATIEDVELSKCTIGVLCDITETASGFRYSISGCHIFNMRVRGVIFADCNAVMDDCLVERCGGELTVGGNVIAGGNQGTLDLLITNSIIREAIYGRNFNMESTGKATIEDSIIMNALGTATHSDEILQYRGTLNLNRCILKAGQRACVNMTAAGGGSGICNINHCDIMDTNATNQWGAFSVDPGAVMTVRNSILTGPEGLYVRSGKIDSNWNDNYCVARFSGPVVSGPNDIDVDPFYIQTDDPNEPNFFALQPYSPVAHADEDGNCMGSQGVIYGQEKWPADLVGGHGVDFNDFAALARNLRKDNTIPAIPQLVLDNFESYTSDSNLLNSWKVSTWTYTTGEWQDGWIRRSSTLSLLTDANDANSPTKAMKWVYDVNTLDSEANQVRYTEIIVTLPAAVNLAPYNELRLSLRRDANNSPEDETYMYAKFFDITQGPPPPTNLDKYDEVGRVIGGSTSTRPGEYYDWTINLDNYVPGPYGTPIGNRTNVGAIGFGIRTQSVGPYGLGRGTIYVDDIRLVDRPGCSGNPVGDLNNDCRVNFADVKIFTIYWLMGK